MGRKQGGWVASHLLDLVEPAAIDLEDDLCNSATMLISITQCPALNKVSQPARSTAHNPIKHSVGQDGALPLMRGSRFFMSETGHFSSASGSTVWLV